MRLETLSLIVLHEPLSIVFEIIFDFSSKLISLASNQHVEMQIHACCLLKGGGNGHKRGCTLRRKLPRAFSCDPSTFVSFLAFEISDGEKYETGIGKSKSWNTL